MLLELAFLPGRERLAAGGAPDAARSLSDRLTAVRGRRSAPADRRLPGRVATGSLATDAAETGAPVDRRPRPSASPVDARGRSAGAAPHEPPREPAPVPPTPAGADRLRRRAARTAPAGCAPGWPGSAPSGPARNPVLEPLFRIVRATHPKADLRHDRARLRRRRAPPPRPDAQERRPVHHPPARRRPRSSPSSA